MMKKLLALLLLIIMFIPECQSNRAYAESQEGTCGENVTWQLNEGILTIIGSGEMTSAPWYRYCDDILSVRIEDGITSICDYAFQYCKHMTDVVIPDSVTTIGRLAFYNCSSLQTLVLPDSVTELSGGAFSGCSSLKEVRLSGSLTDIRKFVFDHCDALTHLDIPEGVIRLNSVPDNIETITLPSSLRYFGQAFSSHKHLKSVSIPEGITTIHEVAFMYCTELTEVNLPQSLEKIGSQAFGECHNLSRIIIPSSVRFIDSIGIYRDYHKYPVIVCEADSYAAEWARNRGCSTEFIMPEPSDDTTIKKTAEAVQPEEGKPEPFLTTEVTYWSEEIGALDFEPLPVYVSGDYYYADLPDGTVAILGYTGKKKTADLQEAFPDRVISSVCGDGFEYFEKGMISPGYPLLGWKHNPNGPALTFASKVIIPESVKCIDSTFGTGSPDYDPKRQLTEINIPAETKSLYRYCFGGYSKLSSLPLINLELQKDAYDLFWGYVSSEIIIPEGYVYLEPGMCNYSKAGKITMPFGIKEIYDSFEGCSFSTVRIPDSTMLIGEKSFLGRKNKPVSCAFEVTEGSYAEWWANKMGYKTKVITPVSSISLSETDILIGAGSKAKLQVTAEPANATNKKLIWTTGNPEVATVKNGTVSGIKEGTCDIICEATDGSGVKSVCHVKTIVWISSIKPAQKKLQFSVGETSKVEYTILPANATIQDLNWYSSDETVCTVDELGTVKAIAAGKCKLTCSATDGSGKSATINITVE